MNERECPECGSHDVRIDPTTPFGYWCGNDACEAFWDEFPEDQDAS